MQREGARSGLQVSAGSLRCVCSAAGLMSCCTAAVQDEKLAEARAAFEALNEARRRLQDPGTLVRK